MYRMYRMGYRIWRMGRNKNVMVCLLIIWRIGVMYNICKYFNILFSSLIILIINQ